ncbi:MAG: uracil-DNA glycosylase [Nitrospinae bacterium]|nr:uracil-DNA glycosylase [Nitrospinota bacterium]
MTIEGLRKKIAGCQRCHLYTGRTNIVFGTGNEDADLLFVSGAPQRDEDIQGIPFVGKVGELLTKIIEAINLKREDVYITNIIKCPPPQDRDPYPNEINACEPFLIEQIKIIKPKVLCALGTFAAQTLLKTDKKISELRGRFYSYHDIKLMPTYHPAYLLDNPADKKDVWKDMQAIGIEVRSIATV